MPSIEGSFENSPNRERINERSIKNKIFAQDIPN